MTTNMKVIIAAVGVALLASPVMAQPERHEHAASIAHAQRSVTLTQARPVVQRDSVEGGRIDINDCNVKSILTQCGFAH
jgi:hypothetical protein